MIVYSIKRLLMIIPIMICVSLLLFLLLSLSPGDPALIAVGVGATDEQLALFREQTGLNDPLVVQYLNYLGGVVQGDLGTSYITRQSVNSMIAARIGNTLFLSFVSMAFTIVIALVLGVAMAIKQNSIFDNTMRLLTIFFTSMPLFWLGLMLIMLFSVKLDWLPSSGLDTWQSAIMPVFVLSCWGVTLCARTGRSSMLEVINQDYIRTARAKGLRYSYVIRRHALKNALLPMISVYGRIIAQCFGGSVVIEQVFGINGIGTLMTNALRQQDIPAIMGCIVVSAFVVTLVNLITDIAYAFIDPRIKSKYVKRKNKAEAVTVNE